MSINYLIFLQEIRENMSGLTAFFNLLSHLAGSTLAVIVVAITYWCISKEVGTMIGFSVACGGLVNQTLKNAFCIPRPWIKSSKVIPDKVAKPGASGYSFPSGHTETGTAVYGSIAVAVRRNWIRALLILFILLIGFSRNFLGVHTPQDVICGWLTGTIGIIVGSRVLHWAEADEGRDIKLVAIMAVITAVFLLWATFKPYPEYEGVNVSEMIEDCYKMAALFLGVGVGWLLERRFIGFTTDGLRAKAILLRIIGGVAGILIVNAICGMWDGWTIEFVKTFVIVLYTIAIWPAAFMKLEKSFGA